MCKSVILNGVVMENVPLLGLFGPINVNELLKIANVRIS